MELLNNLTDEFSLIISFESHKSDKIKFKLGDKLEDTLKKFADEIKEDVSSFLILYSGKILKTEDLQKTFNQVINKQDLKDKVMNMLIYRKSLTPSTDPSMVTIMLIINSTYTITLKGDRDEKIKDIILKGYSKIQKNLTYSSFIYNNKEVDLNKTFEEIASNRDKIVAGMTIYINTTSLIVYFVDEKE